MTAATGGIDPTPVAELGADLLRPRRLVVVGAAGAATMALQVIEDRGDELVCFVDERRTEDTVHPDTGHPVRHRLADVADLLVAPDVEVVLAIGVDRARGAVAERLRRDHPGVRFARLVHPTALLSRHARLGAGVLVSGLTWIGHGAVLGDHAWVQATAAVGHGARVGALATMSGGALLGGDAVLGTASRLGLRASVREKARVGDDTVVGAHAYVHHDLPDRVVAVGVPARVVRSREPDEHHLR